MNTNYERSLSNVLAETKGKYWFSLSIIVSLIRHVEECVEPVKYKEVFSDLSDVEIPMETVSIGMELGEGT